MYLAKVIGTVVSTTKDPSLGGMKLLMISRLDLSLELVGSSEVAVDTVGAGIGEIVIVSNGSSARFAQQNKDYSVIDAAIVGIVDSTEFVHE
ncbi:EutN/CcmL family microcompartment protein [Lonepinella koalarum]|uniref:Ethanolamine utilization protein EutN n=1 Tax=Lonepinella koalarum TaxID=53417 RepID=A0A4R1KPL9_9PAST|nr:EutN/CcmL family microcompartment protein [Lonepinella koalarum]MDH2926652.1 ethanolamine utilization protein EutN [Lonepinella koalarum]TCK66976.1 ethanolamine utilization protein EutN [Lonepinella koalarum]TFJ88955.1 ethanolamine utilization protein EutN [Lonepinella koalarum]